MFKKSHRAFHAETLLFSAIVYMVVCLYMYNSCYSQIYIHIYSILITEFISYTYVLYLLIINKFYGFLELFFFK